MRTKLFLSYSRGDSWWRDAFVAQLESGMNEELWIDSAVNGEGVAWLLLDV